MASVTIIKIEHTAKAPFCRWGNGCGNESWAWPISHDTDVNGNIENYLKWPISRN